MAIAYVKTHGTNNGSTSTNTLTLVPTSTIPVGNFLVMGIGGGTSGQTVTVTDTQSNTYQVDRTQNGNLRTCYIVSCKVTTQLTTGDTITVTYSGNTTNRMISVDEFSGMDPTTWLSNATGTVGTSATPDSTNVTAAAAGSMLYGACVYANGGVSYAPGSTNGGAYVFTESNEVKIAAANGLETEYFVGVGLVGGVSTNGTITSAGWTQTAAIYTPPTSTPSTQGLWAGF